MLALNPDLIITSSNDGQYLEQLSKIAKTVTVNATLNWQKTIKGVAAAIGEESGADAYINQFLSKQAEVAANIDKSREKGVSPSRQISGNGTGGRSITAFYVP